MSREAERKKRDLMRWSVIRTFNSLLALRAQIAIDNFTSRARLPLGDRDAERS
jgi:hypothetical protein